MAFIASLAVVAGLGSFVFMRPTPRPSSPKERVVYFKYLCNPGQPGVRQNEYVVYGPNCLPSFIWN
jgi:hypothetical protein